MITSNEMEYMKENFLHSSHFSFITVKITFIFTYLFIVVVTSGSKTDVLTVYWLKGNLADGECVKNIFFNSLSNNSYNQN